MDARPFESMDSKIRMRIGGEAMSLLQKAKEGQQVTPSLCALLAKLEPLCQRMQNDGTSTVTGRLLANTVARFCRTSAGLDARRSKAYLKKLKCFVCTIMKAALK